MRHRTALATLALTAGLVSGCGGSSAPTDASAEDFCTGFETFAGTVGGAAGDDTSAQVRAAKDAVADLEETGTPSDMPEQAREGFDLFTGLIGDLDDDVSEDELTDIGDDLSDEEDEQLQAFEDYASSTCAPASGDAPDSTDSPDTDESDD